MKKLWAVICGLAIVGCAASGNYIYQYNQNKNRAQQQNEDIQNLARKKSSWLPGWTVEVYAEETTPETQATPEDQTAPVEIPIDFEAIQQVNEDIYGWIYVPGTNVDYPILQHPENDAFYLDHGLDKEDSFPGCIYTEKRNHQDFSDFNTVLYGHNMKDGSMFGSLHRFRDRKFFDENREMIVYTPEHIYHYTIFAAYKYDNRHILNSWNFEQVEDTQQATAESSTAESSTPESTSAVIPASETSTAETSASETSTAETSASETSTSETSTAETSTSDTSTSDNTAENNVSEEPSADASDENNATKSLYSYMLEEGEEIDEELLERQLKVRHTYLRELYDIRAMDAFILQEPIVTEEDRILTLSTCINDPEYRYLVQGVLTETE